MNWRVSQNVPNVLGIEIDSVQMKLQLLEDKLERVKTLVAEWQGERLLEEGAGVFDSSFVSRVLRL